MKILHICLANFYIDNYSYQENLLTKYHKKLGYKVEIIASLLSFNEKGESCLLDDTIQYINEHGIPVTRLAYKKYFGASKFRIYTGTYHAILRAKPDIIFIHGCQFIDIREVVKYIKENPRVTVYVDNHADFQNSAKNWVSKNILHKVIWRRYANLIEPYTTKFYGVLPARVDFLKEVYKLPKEKVELLLMGADDEKVLEATEENFSQGIREKYGIKPEDFLIMTGGKIDQGKTQILVLMKFIRENQDKNIKLIVFGPVIDDLKEEINSLADGIKVQYIGWISSEDSYKYFSASDLVVFPTRHSVFWEQVVGLGIPMVVRYWPGTTHVDLGGNCRFLYNDTIDEMKTVIEPIINDPMLYENMKQVADQKGMKCFSYINIARQSIEKKKLK